MTRQEIIDALMEEIGRDVEGYLEACNEDIVGMMHLACKNLGWDYEEVLDHDIYKIFIKETHMWDDL